MKAQTKAQKLSTSNIDQTQPHQRHAGGYKHAHGRRHAPKVRRERIGAGRRNRTVEAVREYGRIHTTNLKQTGRRYGPSPHLDGIHEPWPRSQPKPMEHGRRVRYYAAQNGYARLTDRQHARAGKKVRRSNKGAQT